MNDSPYKPPTSSAATQAVSKDKEALLFIIGLVCATLGAVCPMLILPVFKKVFDSVFDVLPGFTALVLQIYPGFWLLIPCVIFVRFRWPNQSKRPKAACIAGIMALLLSVAVTLVAAYLPALYVLTGKV